MVTIYFDTHVFRRLYKEQEEKFQVLRKKILEHKEEFIEKFDEAIANNQKSVREYIFETIEEHTKYETIKRNKYEGRTFTHIKPYHSHFGYFNQMIEALSENDWVIMVGKRNGLNQSILIKEIEIIVNRISKVFGNIGFEYQPFQFETECEQLKEDNWIGREWICPHFTIRLEKLKEYANLCLIINDYSMLYLN